MAAQQGFTSVRLREGAVENLRRLTRQLAAEADRDVSQSDALAAAAAYSLEHLGEVAAILGRAVPRSESAPAPGAESETSRATD